MSQKVKGKDTHPTMGVINIGENSMEKQIVKTLTEEKYVITCKLADECGNGVEHFSITYDMYKKGRNGHWYTRGGGCGSDLYKKFKELELICKLHLSLFNGVPFYAVKNGMYHGAYIYAYKKGNSTHYAISRSLISPNSYAATYNTLEGAKAKIDDWNNT